MDFADYQKAQTSDQIHSKPYFFKSIGFITVGPVRKNQEWEINAFFFSTATCTDCIDIRNIQAK